MLIITQARGRNGWILAKFSFRVFIHKNAKRELGQHPVILTALAWSIKDLLYGMKNTEKDLDDLSTCLFSSTEKEASYLQK